MCLGNADSPEIAFKEGWMDWGLCHWFEFADLGLDLLMEELNRVLSFKYTSNICLKILSVTGC